MRTDRQTDGQTGMSKLIVAFRNFANPPKNEWRYVLYTPYAFKMCACTNLPSHKVITSQLGYTRVGTLIEATIYLQLIQNRYMFQSFTVLHCSHQHCVQPVASDVEVVGYL